MVATSSTIDTALHSAATTTHTMCFPDFRLLKKRKREKVFLLRAKVSSSKKHKLLLRKFPLEKRIRALHPFSKLPTSTLSSLKSFEDDNRDSNRNGNGVSRHLQIWILFIGQWHLDGISHLLLVLGQERLVDLNFRRSKSWCSNKFLCHLLVQIPVFQLHSNSTYQGLVTDKFACQPQEWLLEVVVGFGRDIVVL